MGPAAFLVANKLNTYIAAPYAYTRRTFEASDLQSTVLVPELRAPCVVLLATDGY